MKMQKHFLKTVLLSIPVLLQVSSQGCENHQTFDVDWFLFMDIDELTANVGDTIRWVWEEEEEHDVDRFVGEEQFDNCDFEGAAEVGEISGTTYVVTVANLVAGSIFFGCSVGEGFHCNEGTMKLKAYVQLCTECKDFYIPWTDSQGANCNDYEANDWCGLPRNQGFANFGYTGDQNCCVCGGGFVVDPMCQDLTDGWIDKQGDGCDTYVQNEWCGDPMNQNYENIVNGYDADENCCGCGGGSPGTDQDCHHCSRNTCENLGLRTVERITNICSETDFIYLGGFCSGAVNWEEAVEFCENGGMRLCSEIEVLSGITADRGCGYDYELIWTKDACGARMFKVAIGEGGDHADCRNMEERAEIFVRCCADSEDGDDECCEPLPGECRLFRGHCVGACNASQRCVAVYDSETEDELVGCACASVE